MLWRCRTLLVSRYTQMCCALPNPFDGLGQDLLYRKSKEFTLIKNIVMKHATMKEVLTLIVFLFLLTGNTSGQTNNPNVTPPTPNAAAFAKYGNTPVSPYTGVANV